MQQNHIVSGIYSTRGEAEEVYNALVNAGLPCARLQISEQKDMPDQLGDQPESKKLETDNTVLKNVVVDGGIGTAVGAGLGVLAEVALVAANVTLFVASPLIAPLAMLGWGAAVGGLVGAAVGAEKTAEENEEGRFSELVLDAIRSGHVVLVVHTLTDQEIADARRIVGDSLTSPA